MARYNLGIETSLMKPAKYDKDGPMYAVEDVREAVKSKILVDNYFEGKVKPMVNDVERAIEKTEAVTESMAQTLNKFFDMEQKLSAETKRASGNVRDASDKLASGLARVENAANFDRLERYVGLLERAASAMNSLAELEASGKLEKIAASIR